MEYKKLGKSDVLVSELILGCWAMGGDYLAQQRTKLFGGVGSIL